MSSEGPHPLDVLEDQVEFALAPECFAQLHDVLLLEGSKHLQLPQRRPLDIVVLCKQPGTRDHGTCTDKHMRDAPLLLL